MTYKLGEEENATQIAKYKYSYNKNGNITEVWEGNNQIAEYTYDTLNQLKTSAEINAKDSEGKGGYKEYFYDNAGNITSVKEYSLTSDLKKLTDNNDDLYYYCETEYENNSNTWGDLLTKYRTYNITYDEIGNPLNYRDGMTMSWTGRELQSITKGNDSYSFTYNLDGLRTKKSINGTNTFYYYDDSNNLIGLKKGNTTVLFYYDSEGSLYSMSKGEDTYFFIKDLQGDVRKIIDENGTVCATYFYDAWGALLAENEDSSVEGLNPFRYKGYVYDHETQLYYLQSRYYDPKTGRFINADSPEYTDTFSGTPLSTNMFAYCENNAVNRCDPTGRKIIKEKYKVSASNQLGTISSNKKIYVLYYSYNGGSGSFISQAKNSYHYNSKSKNTHFKGFQTKQQFIKAWNSIPYKTDYIFIFAHGAEGYLFFKNGEELKGINSLKNKHVNCKLWVFACRSGTGGKNSIAAKFAKLLFGTIVVGFNGNLSFSDLWEGYYGRPKLFTTGYWKYFRYFYDSYGRLKYDENYYYRTRIYYL